MEGFGEIDSTALSDIPYPFITPYSLEAIWEIKIYYDTHSGQNLPQIYDEVDRCETYRYGDSLLSLRNPGRNGTWTFGGWYTGASGTGESFNNNEIINTSDPKFQEIVNSKESRILFNGEYCIRLYAKWTSTTSLNYRSGYTPSSELPKTLSFVHGQSYKQSQEPEIFPTKEKIVERDGYNKGEWYNNNDYTGANITENTTDFPLDFDTIYFQWVGTECKVFFAYQGATNYHPFTFSKTVVRGEDLKAITGADADSIVPIGDIPNDDEHGTFSGYYYNNIMYYRYDANSGFTGVRPFDILDPTGEGITLEAGWGKSFKITLNPNEGSGGTSSVYAIYEQDMPSGKNIMAPTRNGYTFDGYYDNKDVQSTANMYYTKDMQSAKEWNKTTTATLYAKWIPNEHVVTINENNVNVTIKRNDTNVEVNSGDKVPFGTSLSISCTTNKGYKNGWCTDNGKTISMPDKNITIDSGATKDSCIIKGTPMLLANGTSVNVEKLKIGDSILTFDHQTGKYVASEVGFIYYAFGKCPVTSLYFTNDVKLEIVNEHGLFDVTLNKYILISLYNINEFIGHEFAYVTFENGIMVNKTIKLLDWKIIERFVERYDIVTNHNLNHIANGLLSCTDLLVNFANTFEFNNMVYDLEKMEADIIQYGLFEYDEWAEYITYEEFVSFNGAYFKVAVGKGLLSEEDLFELISYLRTMWQS